MLAACHAGDRLTAVDGDGPAIAVSKPVSLLNAVTVACGASVVTDLKVGNDLVCAGDALSIDADGITIDLNGHTFTGNGTGNGITVRARQNVTVRGGTIRNFTTGVFVANSTGILIHENHLTNNREGVFLNGSSNSIVRENVASQNQLRGIMLRPTLSGVVSTQNVIRENVLLQNPSGILVFGQSDNTFLENWISESSVAGLDLIGGGASGNLFGENRIEMSAVGINFGAGWSGNAFVQNQLVANACALKGTTGGNTFADNQLIGNAADSC